jgi:outer membrane protein TolC
VLLLQAKINLITALSDRQMAWYQLQHAIGSLSEKVASEK